jgi:hypothetical protein
MIASTKKFGKFIPGSGIGFNKGRIAGGRTAIIPAGKTDVFGSRPYDNPPSPNWKGGLIDKQQQKNPKSTAGLTSPQVSPMFRPIPTQPKHIASAAVNSIPGNKIFGSFQKTVVSDRGTFFAPKVKVPVVRTAGGANKSGMKPNTPFHPNPLPTLPPQQGAPVVSSEKLVNKTTPASFTSTGNHWSDPHNSFIKGAQTAATKTIGTGRWNTTKRSTV